MIEISERTTPMGDVRIAVREKRLVGLAFVEGWLRVDQHLLRRFPDDDFCEPDAVSEAAELLDAYMAGELEALDRLAIDTGGTSFQRRIWSAIRTVAPCQTLSYAELARTAGAPKAARAAGSACGANPIWVVIPCHRIVSGDGGLGHYGGGLERKRWLLDHERQHARGPAPTDVIDAKANGRSTSDGSGSS
ncbi:MAG: methylated-DNA--[protein]-cysteine S-methyltransferase [Solirubrobacterales bacterium]